jgi:hypothetical protein
LAKSLVPDFDLIEKTRFYMFDIMNALDMVWYHNYYMGIIF